MSSRALDIVDEFRRSSDPQMQKNAATALAAIGTAESIGRLVDLVLEGRDSGLRRRVLDELVRLDVAGKEEAVQMLRRELAEAEGRELADARQRAQRAEVPEADRKADTHKDAEQGEGTRRERGERAYWVLGQLRARGRAVGTFSGGWRQRIERALRLQDRIRRTEGSGGLEAAVRGSVTGLLLLVWPYTAIGYAPELGRVLPLLLAALLGGIVLVVMGIRRTAPIDLYPDSAAGIVAELVGTVRASWLAAVILALLAVLTPAVSANGEAGMVLPVAAVAWAASTLLILLLVMTVRLGTIVSRAFLPGPRLQLVGQVAGGAGAGIVFATLAALAVSALANAAPGGQPLSNRMDLLWLLLLPFCVAAALAFVRTDRRAPREIAPVPRHVARPAFTLILLLSVLLAGLSVRAQPLWLRLGSHQMLPARLVPAELKFEVPAPRYFRAFALQEAAGEDLVLMLRNGSETLETGDDPAEVELDLLPQGVYALTVWSFSTRVDDAPLPLNRTVPPDLLRRLFARWLVHSAPVQFMPLSRADSTSRPFHVTLELLPPDVAAPRKATRALAETVLNLLSVDAIDSAIGEMARADSSRGRDVLDPLLYQQVCWRGITSGKVERVVGFCEEAARREPAEPYFLSNRGIARALSGNRAGAIEDFRALVQDATVSTVVRQRRLEFISRLQQGGTLTLDDVARVTIEESNRLTVQDEQRYKNLPVDSVMVPEDTVMAVPPERR